MTELTESYACCARVARQAASHFYLAFFLLSRPKRRAMCALYAFLRATDDLADRVRPVDLRRTDLTAWRAGFQAALVNQPLPSDCPAELRPILPALLDTVKRYQIPSRYLMDVIEGVEMDLDRARYETRAELQQYCYHVASAVGLACIHIWGFRDPQAMVLAEKCGYAFQLTNILRDLKEDAALGRVYLPEEDLVACGYSAEELLRGVANEPFRRVVRLEIDRAEQWYRESAPLENYLEPDGGRVFGAMFCTYRRLLDEIRRRDGDLFDERVHLGRWQRAGIAAKWLLLRPTLAQVPAPDKTIEEKNHRGTVLR